MQNSLNGHQEPTLPNQTLPKREFTATIDSLTQDGRGVARVQGKATFITGALPGETVRFVYTRRKKKI